MRRTPPTNAIFRDAQRHPLQGHIAPIADAEMEMACAQQYGIDLDRLLRLADGR